FVERFVHLPRREKVRGGRGKHALREALRGRLPARVLDGPKRGFDTPLGRWIRGGLAEAVADALETLPETWVDRETLRRRYAEHQAGRRDHAHLLWSLLVLEHWRRRHDVRGVAA
ncbi:MAG: asparagine synthase-related protein, partial [Planctomycetota bacterium]|nr:asparagine synthase-related protein [Planctomycetota bacterium]